MTTEEKKVEQWYCEKCPTFKGDDSDAISVDSSLFKNVKLVHEKHKGWQIGTPNESLKDGVKVDKSKSIDENFAKEWNEVNKNSLTDVEIKIQLKTNWKTVKSNTSWKLKEVAQKRINELEKLLDQEITKFASPEIQKEIDKQWKILKSQKGSGVRKKEKDKAREKINELEKLGGIEITDLDDDEKPDEIDLNHVRDVILSNHDFLTINDKNRTLHVYQDGVYQPDGETIIEVDIETLYPIESSIRFRKEVIEKIKIKTLIDREELDKDDNIKNVRNGLFDIEKHQLIPHSPSHKSILQWNVIYNKDAKCLKIIKFLNDVILEDSERLTVLEMVAELLWKYSTLTKSYFLLGKGSNGKTVLRKIVLELVGMMNNANLTFDDFSDKYKPAELDNKIVSFPDEIDDTKIVKSASWKTATAKESILAQRKFGQPFVFTPYAKIIMPCNNPPEIDDKSDGTYRRIVPIHFSQTFVTNLTPEYEQKGFRKIDEDFTKSLLEEAEISGLFNILVLIVRQMKRRQRLTFNLSIDEVRKEWETISNKTIEFIQDMLVFDEKAFALKTDYLRSYIKFCKIKRYKPDGINTFYANFQREGAIDVKRRLHSKGTPQHCFSGFWFKGVPKEETKDESQSTLN